MHSQVYSLSIIDGGICTGPANLSGCLKDSMAWKVWNIYSLVIYRKALPKPAQKNQPQEPFPRRNPWTPSWFSTNKLKNLPKSSLFRWWAFWSPCSPSPRFVPDIVVVCRQWRHKQSIDTPVKCTVTKTYTTLSLPGNILPGWLNFFFLFFCLKVCLHSAGGKVRR